MPCKFLLSTRVILCKARKQKTLKNIAQTCRGTEIQNQSYRKICISPGAASMPLAASGYLHNSVQMFTGWLSNLLAKGTLLTNSHKWSENCFKNVQLLCCCCCCCWEWWHLSITFGFQLPILQSMRGSFLNTYFNPGCLSLQTLRSCPEICVYVVENKVTFAIF